MVLNKQYYKVFRSRNNGQCWSNLTQNRYIDYQVAVQIVDDEHSKHPSDMLRVVEVTEKSVYGYDNAKTKFEAK